MRVGTLTFHSTDNYGAMLQAYALPKAVEQLGHSCEVIDYRHSAVTHGVEIQWPKDLVKQYGLLRGAVKSLNRWRMGWFSSSRKDVRFNRFMTKRLPLSPKTYRHWAELKELDYDAVLFGSDQIWNDRLTNGISLAYFGKEIPGRKIAYAASTGTDQVPHEALPMLKEFSALGIRELGLTQTLKEKGLEAQTVLDPVLLLTKQQWEQIEAPLPKGLKKDGYIFVYTFDDQPVYDLARKISKEEGLPIVNVRWCGANKRFSDMMQLPNASPEEFLALLHHAAVVCTSSFHGTAFSVLFGKRFYCCTPSKFGSRTNSLLSRVGLMECRVEDGNYAGRTPDYAGSRRKLEALREESLTFLRSALEQGE